MFESVPEFRNGRGEGGGVMGRSCLTTSANAVLPVRQMVYGLSAARACRRERETGDPERAVMV